MLGVSSNVLNASGRQGKGHGTKLMEGMKRIAARDGLGHLFTYGDNTALGFFEKHEFSKEITMHRDLW